jgi:hypothetical protein
MFENINAFLNNDNKDIFMFHEKEEKKSFCMTSHMASFIIFMSLTLPCIFNTHTLFSID